MKTLFYFSVLIFVLTLNSSLAATVKAKEAKHTELYTPARRVTNITINAFYVFKFVRLPAGLATIRNRTTGQTVTTDAFGQVSLSVSVGDRIDGSLNVAGLGLVAGATTIVPHNITNGYTNLDLK